jgi:hypothetical protein
MGMALQTYKHIIRIMDNNIIQYKADTCIPRAPTFPLAKGKVVPALNQV